MNKTVIQLGVVTVLLVAAGVLFIVRKPAAEPLDAPETKSIWLCDGCQARYDLTAKQLDEWEADTSRWQRVGVDPRSHVSGQQAFLCEKCKQMAVVAAEECPDHQTVAVIRHIDGKVGGCP